jgi:hypothetical protein
VIRAALAALAIAQMAAPAAAVHAIMVPVCGSGAPIRLPARDEMPACKICHIAMRRRGGGDSCCGHEDDSDAA